MRKFIFCMAIIIIMIVTLFSAGCIDNENDEGIDNPLDILPGKTISNAKYSIEQIEEMVTQNSNDYRIIVGTDGGDGYFRSNYFTCNYKRDGHLYSHSVDGNFTNYVLTHNTILLSQEKSLYIVKDTSKAGRFVTIIPKDKEPDDAIATLFYVKENTFQYLCRFLPESK